MAFYAGQIVKHPAMENPTLVVSPTATIWTTSSSAPSACARTCCGRRRSRRRTATHLRKLLDRPSGGVIFTTLQKFAPEQGTTDYPLLTDRRNVIVIADEAHRSQYGFNAKVARKTGDISYGFAKYLRDALPNASFIGFTGTPIETGRCEHAGGVRRLHRHLRHQPRGRGRRDRADLLRKPAGAHRARRGREAQDRRGDRRADRGRGARASRSGSSANGRASRRWSARRSAWRWSPRTW